MIKRDLVKWCFAVLLALLWQFTYSQECATEGEPIEYDSGRLFNWHYIDAVVHVIHRSTHPYGTGSNITNEQIYSGIQALNRALQQPTNTRIRVRLRDITRQTWTILYDAEGVHPNGYSGGESELLMKQTFGWPSTEYLNIYLVWSTCLGGCNFGGAGVQGWATFPPWNVTYQDGIVQLSNTFGAKSWGEEALPFVLKLYTNLNSTTSHEFGHFYNLYHTFQSTDNCFSETNCLTQGDRCCDTPPHNLTNACPSITCDPAPVYNHMSYSSQVCRSEFTPDQIDRMQAAAAGNNTRIQLAENSTPPALNCPGDNCANAVQIQPCTPFSFDNTQCSTNFMQEGMSAMVGNCANTNLTTPCGADYTHGQNIWLAVTLEGGMTQITINTNYTYAGVTSGAFGLLHGVHFNIWQAGETCGDAEVIWGTACYTSAQCNPGIVSLPSGMGAYDPTRQNWDLTFDNIPAGDYLIEIFGFMGFQGGEPATSQGQGTITVCNPSPLPVELLYLEVLYQSVKDVLTWATATETNNDYFTIYRTSDFVSFDRVTTVWGAVNSSTLNSYNIEVEPSQGEYYYILDQTDLNGTTKRIGQVAVNRVQCEAEYYTITGQRVTELGRGVYIKKCGDVVTKVVK